MPRAIWTGTISFGLVNVPVRMYSGVRKHTLHFNFVHEPDGGRIGYEKVCKEEGRQVPDSEIVRAFEIEPGEWVYMSDEDFEAAAEDGTRTIDIRDFVARGEIDPAYFENTYYLGPQEGSERVYALFARALEESGLTGVAKFVMRDRQHLGALRVRDGTIVLERMHFADEVRDPGEVAPEGVEVDERELEMATQLIERFRSDWEPERYEDTYRDALCEIIRAKQAGEQVRHVAEPEPEEPDDLMAALRASLEAAQSRRPGRPSRDGARSDGRNGDLSALSKDELLELAREADVRGRSQMTKDELVEALGDAR